MGLERTVCLFPEILFLKSIFNFVLLQKLTILKFQFYLEITNTIMTNSQQTGDPQSTPLQASDCEITNQKSSHKKIPRCVSMCNTTDSESKGDKDASTRSSSPSRKRPRDTIEEPERTSPNVSSRQRNEKDLDPTSRLNENQSNNRTNIASIRKKNRKKESIPLNFNIKALNDADPNIAYTPYITNPASPVRSVVSCDLDAGYPSNMICEDVLDNPCIQERQSQDEQKQDQQDAESHGKAAQQDLELELEQDEEQLLLKATANLPQDLQIHIRALRIEASLSPMKQLLHRLLTHQTYNRKGWFNVPVDSVALGLKDYNIVVKRPMDLGTIKRLLLTNVYHSHVEVARDIRLVFRNACLYNPPKHPVHEAAKYILDYFEDAYAIILSKSATPDQSKAPAMSTVAGSTIGKDAMTPNTVQSLPKTYALPPIRHTCKSCIGRACKMCSKGCLSLEPSLLICAGTSCSGTKIRRGIYYYCVRDGVKTWCQKCYPSLPSLIPIDDGDEKGRGSLHKRDLLKRRNEEDVVERWIDCTKCGSGVHEMCAFVNEFCTDRENFVCPLCADSVLPLQIQSTKSPGGDDKLVYSFLSGSKLPERIKNITDGTPFDARQLPECTISSFIEQKVKERMCALDCPTGAEATVTVKVISDCQKEFSVPEVVLQHFRMQQRADALISGSSGIDTFHEPPSSVGYRSKAIALFQRIDGMDVCMFCMYVQEYDALDDDDRSAFCQQKRVYLAYVDSVEHFRPRCLRTHIYHEILTAYFASARARGFENIHIWSCPPSRGNSFVFWGHPQTQRTPTKEHLLSWYHKALSHAVDRGVVTDVKSLYEHSFEHFDKSATSKHGTSDNLFQRSTMICPPLLEGDFWIEEAVRVHSASISRWSKAKKSPDENSLSKKDGIFSPEEIFIGEHSRCPVIQVAKLIEGCIMQHSLASAFLRPVNAAALKLRDYHVVIKKPMDLGTVLAQCLLGEYETFQEVLADIELIFTNAMRYNPKGHIIHSIANDLLEFTQQQFSTLVNYWRKCGIEERQSNGSDEATFAFNDLSMRLSTVIKLPSAQISDTASSSGIKEKGTKSSEIIDHSNLLFGGAEGIARLMVGEDVWLLDKRHTHKDTSKKKKKNGKNKDLVMEPHHSDSSKRCESWLSDEVLATVRKLRAGIFVCHLKPKAEKTCMEETKEKEYIQYIEGFDLKSNPTQTLSREVEIEPGVSETRHGLVSFYHIRMHCAFLIFRILTFCVFKTARIFAVP